MSDNIIGFERKKKMYYRFTIQIKYIDNEEEDIECTFFGSSADNPEFLLFSNAHPDDDSELAQIPDLLINSNSVKTIRTKKIVEIEE